MKSLNEINDDDYVDAIRFAQAKWYDGPDMLSRQAVYQWMPPVWIGEGVEPTSETCRQADLLFDSKIKTQPGYKARKEHEKRLHFQKLFHASKRASYQQGCVVCPRDRERAECSHANLQVVACAVQSGLLDEFRSPPGSPKATRLVPTSGIRVWTEIDPWDFDPELKPGHRPQYVFLRSRRTKEKEAEDMPFDPQQPVAAKYQKRLTKINEVNGFFNIYYRHFCPWSQTFEARRQLRPVHYARFTDDFDQHGRIYTGKYGHQSLRKCERATIEFEMEPRTLEPSVELDYGSYHTLMAYHLEGINYRHDPYLLWGEKTTPPMRLVAKKLINAALSAKDAKAAIDSCNLARNPRTDEKHWKDGKSQWKQGKALEDALMLDRACRETGLSFADVHRLALKKHKRIAHRFGSDAGMEFMRIDSEIALSIMFHFAKLGLPVLGVHDSFIVPRTAKTELYRVMRKFYRQKLGFWPVLKQ